MALSGPFYDHPELTKIFDRRKNIGFLELFEKHIEELSEKGIGKIVTKNNTVINLDIWPDVEDCNDLYEAGVKSKIGKYHLTVEDETIRKSREITSDNILWSKKLSEIAHEYISKILTEMNAGTLRKCTPHKILMYREGDFFNEHIDNIHTPGQSMTAILEVASEYTGGALVVDGVNYGEAGETGFYVFDHDKPHAVREVTDGMRISVTFNLEVDPKNLGNTDEVFEQYISQLVGKLKKKGVKRFGFFSSHLYLDDREKKQDLKGTDAIVCRLLQKYAKLEMLDLFTDTCTRWYREEVWELMNSGPEAGHLLYEADCTPDYCIKPMYGEEPTEDKWEEQNDTMTEIVKGKFCLNDVYCLWSPWRPRLYQERNEEVWLGNEGFHGEVHDCRFFLFEFECENCNSKS